MNRRQKLIQQQFLSNEKGIIKRLDQVYGQALKDVNANIERLMKRFDPETGDLMQSAVYQLKYQRMIKDQLEGILNQLQTKQFTSVSEYLDTCYEDGFVGSLFDLHGQGVPLMMPLDQEAMVTAVQLDSKISQGLYTRLGEDVDMLKKHITAQVSRSIATGTSFADTAKQLAGKTRIGYNNAIRIARTEGHRIQNQATMNVMEQAKDRGADVVKQWDATLDGKTRESHVAVDGEIRELDEKFSNGLQFPGDPSGKAAEVVNCRCATLQRARWAVGDGFTKWNNFTKQLETFDSPQQYGEFKKAFFAPENKQYMNYVQQMEKKYRSRDWATVLDRMSDREYKHYSRLLAENTLYNTKTAVPPPVLEVDDFKEITDAIDFEYGNYTTDDYNEWWDAYDAHNSGVHLSNEELKIIDDYTEGSFIALNDVSRYSDDELLKKGYSAEDIVRTRRKADTLEGALAKYDLDTDIVTHRFERDVSWLTGKGNGVADLEGLIGTEYTTKGFTSSGMLPNRFRFTGGKKDAVHFEIVTPKGTNGAFLSMSRKGENEFLYNRNTRYRVLDGGERTVIEKKLNFKTMQMEDVEITERFLRVQVLLDDIADAVDDIADIADAVETITTPVKSMKSVKAMMNKHTFTPATSIKEAEDFIRKYVDDSGFGALGVSYKGISLDVANEVNRAVSNVFETFNIKKLGGVVAPAGNTKLGQMMSSATAAYSPIRKSLLLNRKSLKDMKTAVKAFSAERDAIQGILDHPERYDFDKIPLRLKKVIDRSKVSGRATVPDNIEDAIHHELGHALEKLVHDSPKWDDVRANRPMFADKISGYAGESDSEYIAESFASYLKDEGIIDPVLADIFNGLVR